MVAFDSYSGRRQYKHDVAQLFGGHGDVIRLGIRKGLRPGRNYDAMINIDLSLPEERTRLWSYFKKFWPRVVVASPPCTPFGRWSSYNRARNYGAWRRSFRLASPLAILTALICEFQVRHGRHFVVENPLGSKIFQLPAWNKVLKLPGIVSSRVDQCAYGLSDADGNLIYKPTTFVASHVALLGHLRRKCDGTHHHVQLAGSSYGMPRCKEAQRWPPKLCLAIVEGIRDLIQIKKAQVYVSRGVIADALSSQTTIHADALSSRENSRSELALMLSHHMPFVGAVADALSSRPASEIASNQSAPSHCPACRSHARRDDPRHNRHPAVCKFPNDVGVNWPCPACQRHAHNSSRDHTRIKGSCQWATAPVRSTQSRTAKQRSTSQAPEEEHETESTHPPVTAIGTWTALSDRLMIGKLDHISYRDGWWVVDNDPALVTTQARTLQTSEPRYSAMCENRCAMEDSSS